MKIAKVLRLVGDYFYSLLNYLLAGGSLVATVILLLVLYQIIAQTRASYPPLPAISESSLNKPTFMRSIPVQTPKTFKGTALSISPDGRSLAYWGGLDDTGERGLYTALIDDDDYNLVWQFVSWHRWSPDSKKLLLQARQDQLGAGGIAVANIDGSAFDWIIPPPDESSSARPLPVSAASWYTDEKTVLIVQPKMLESASELWRFQLDEPGKSQRLAILPKETDKPNTFVRKLTLSPDGKKVSFINADRPGAEKSATWWVMNTDGSTPLPLMKRGQGSGFVLNWLWSPDGRQLIYTIRQDGDDEYEPTTLWIMNSDGTARRQVSSSDNIDGFALSPKGNWVIYGKESHLWLLDLESGHEEQLTFSDDSEGNPLWLTNGDIVYHHKVGSITSLRLLVHAEPTDIPGLADATPTKTP